MLKHQTACPANLSGNAYMLRHMLFYNKWSVSGGLTLTRVISFIVIFRISGLCGMLAWILSPPFLPFCVYAAILCLCCQQVCMQQFWVYAVIQCVCCRSVCMLPFCVYAAILSGCCRYVCMLPFCVFAAVLCVCCQQVCCLHCSCHPRSRAHLSSLAGWSRALTFGLSPCLLRQDPSLVSVNSCELLSLLTVLKKCSYAMFSICWPKKRTNPRLPPRAKVC